MKAALPFLACLLAGCLAVPVEAPPSEAPNYGARPVPGEAGTSGPARDWETKSVLYARDGTPIPASGPGAVTQSPEVARPMPTHRLVGDEGGGRMYILELYQKVIEERDALTTEVNALSSELEYMRRTLLEADRRIAELEAMHSEFEREKRALIDENLELAGRLTTAQIRRLQAEKILLERELEDLRLAEAEAAQEPTQP